MTNCPPNGRGQGHINHTNTSSLNFFKPDVSTLWNPCHITGVDEANISNLVCRLIARNITICMLKLHSMGVHLGSHDLLKF